MVAGAESQLWPSGHATETAALSPTGRAEIVQRAGHTVPTDQAKAFNRIVLEFLAESD